MRSARNHVKGGLFAFYIDLSPQFAPRLAGSVSPRRFMLHLGGYLRRFVS
jgi:hypothetical protein